MLCHVFLLQESDSGSFFILTLDKRRSSAETSKQMDSASFSARDGVLTVRSLAQVKMFLKAKAVDVFFFFSQATIG